MPTKRISPKQEAFRFFLKHAGFSYKPTEETKQQGRARCARELAKAEADASALGYTFEWSYDEEGCSGCDCDNKDCACSNRTQHETFNCVCLSPDPSCYDSYGKPTGGAVLSSLGSICEPTREYRRVIEAELALEALAEVSK